MTGKVGMRLKFWKIKPIFLARRWAFLRAEIFSTGSPFKRKEPEVGLSKRPIILSKVVFPQPEGPIIMINSPRLTSREKLLSAKDSASP